MSSDLLQSYQLGHVPAIGSDCKIAKQNRRPIIRTNNIFLDTNNILLDTNNILLALKAISQPALRPWANIQVFSVLSCVYIDARPAITHTP